MKQIKVSEQNMRYYRILTNIKGEVILYFENLINEECEEIWNANKKLHDKHTF